MKSLSLIVLIFTCLLSSCHKKENIEFTLNKLTLNAFEKEKYPVQNYYLKLVDIHESLQTTIYTTDVYPSTQTLPVNYGITPAPQLNFYKSDYAVELWGDSSQLIGTNPIHLEDYKIIYPLEMETEHAEISISLHGTWR